MAAIPTTERPRRQAGLERTVAAWERAPRFVRNAAVSLPTFLIDLALLYGLVRWTHVAYLAATIVAFLAANGLSYFLARRLVFGETKRGVRSGLLYFLAIATLSAVALTPLMWLAVSVLHIDFIVSRVATAAIVGVCGYLLNLMVNFRVARAQRASRAGGEPTIVGLHHASD